MINEKNLKLSENELENIHGMGNGCNEFLCGIVSPFIGFKLGKPVSALGALATHTLLLATTAAITAGITYVITSKIYKKTINNSKGVC